MTESAAKIGCADETFDIGKVIGLFSSSIRDSDDDVDLSLYVQAYRELNKLFGILGIIFKFVEKDVADKEGIIARLIEKESDSYRSVSSMISFEIGGPDTSPKNSGSRTLLRLHRALEFVILFVQSTHDMDSTGSVSHVCRSCYEKTLAHHHGWLIRQSVSVASRTLPTREYLIKEIFAHHDEHVPQELIDKHAKEFHEAATEVYGRIQQLYSKNDILRLP